MLVQATPEHRERMCKVACKAEWNPRDGHMLFWGKGMWWVGQLEGWNGADTLTRQVMRGPAIKVNCPLFQEKYRDRRIDRSLHLE